MQARHVNDNFASSGSMPDECGSNIFEYLSIKDTVIVAAVCKDWQTLSRIEVERRSEKWVQDTSRAWRCKRGDDGDIGIDLSADELPDEKHALDDLDAYWQDNFECPTDILRAVAEWSGGWPRFLHARECGGAFGQPELEVGKEIKFTTLGSDGPMALLYDIRCDGHHAWSGVQPVNSYELGQITVNDASCVSTYPISTKTLGDKADSSIIFPMGQQVRIPRFLLSIDIDDKRSWSVEVSVVSPSCSETSLMTFPIKSASELANGLDSWNEDNGYDENDEYITELRPMYAAKIQSLGWYTDYDFASTPRVEEGMNRGQIQLVANGIRGLYENGSIKQFEIAFADCTYWLDLRNPERWRLHFTVDLAFVDELCSNMILNPRL